MVDSYVDGIYVFRCDLDDPQSEAHLSNIRCPASKCPTRVKVPKYFRGHLITEVYNFAFRCLPLKYLLIPSTVHHIGFGLFDYDRDLEEVVLPCYIEEIPEVSFRCCESLRKMSVPDTVKVIGPHAFEGCTSLKWIEVPYGVEIGEGAFEPTTAVVYKPGGIPGVLKSPWRRMYWEDPWQGENDV